MSLYDAFKTQAKINKLTTRKNNYLEKIEELKKKIVKIEETLETERLVLKMEIQIAEDEEKYAKK